MKTIPQTPFSASVSRIALSVALLVTCAAVTAHAAQPLEPGFKSLFDGQQLGDWKGDPKFWSVKDGAIFCETTPNNPTPKNTFLIYRGEEFEDFELRFTYRVRGGNSGMQYRSEILSDWVVKGYQADFENTNRFTGMFYEENGRGFLARPGEVVQVKPNPQDPTKPRLEKIGSVGTPEEIYAGIDPLAWNDYIIIANGNQFTHIVNGRVITLTHDEDEANARKSGVLAIQCHSGPPMTIEVKNIRIRPLK